MSAKTNGPLFADYYRALKAAKKVGAKAVRVEIGETALTILLDDALASAAKPNGAAAAEEQKGPRSLW